MFSWVKNLFNGDETKVREEGPVIIEPPKESMDREGLILSAEVEAYLNENGPEETLNWLLEKFLLGIRGAEAAELFAGYYEGRCSKKDILDRYEEIIQVDDAVVMALAKLGASYNQEMIKNFLPEADNFSIYGEKFVSELVEDITSCNTSLKMVKRLLWEEYFDCVKTSLDTKKKSGVTDEDKYQPRDEIEATLIMLLEADMKARRNE